MTDRVMVPRRPTAAMREAGSTATWGSWDLADDCWAKMIEAAPPSERWVSNGGDGEYPDLVMVPVEPTAWSWTDENGVPRITTWCPGVSTSTALYAHPPEAPLTVEEVADALGALMNGIHVTEGEGGRRSYTLNAMLPAGYSKAQAILAAMGRAGE